MSGQKQSSDYLFALMGQQESETESQRLNEQHDWIKIFGPANGIHPSIPTDGLVRVAEVGTGTGIWLETFASTVGQHPTTNGEARQYDGWDMSDATWRKDMGPNFNFIKHDMFDPIPEAYRGIYDLVHIRLLILAVKPADLPTILDHAVQLLAPGGYLQWDEWNFSSWGFVNETPAMRQVTEAQCDATITARGYDPNFSELLPPAFASAGLTNVVKTSYHPLDPENRDKAAEAGKVWMVGNLKVGMPFVHGKTADGKTRSVEELEAVLSEKWAVVDGFYEQGGVAGIPLVVTVGRK